MLTCLKLLSPPNFMITKIKKMK